LINGKFISNGRDLIPSKHKSVFITLFFAIFSTITGVGIVVPLLPIYAHELGGTGIYVGMIFGSFSISRIILLPLFGRLSDRKGRKPFIVSGLLAYTLISFAFVLSTNVETLIILRFIQGAASAMIMPVVQAYIGEITQEGSEGYSMSFFNLSMFMSLTIGPLMGGVIKDIFTMDAAFVSMGVLSGLGLLLSIVFLPAVKEENIRTGKQKTTPWQHIIKDRTLIAIFIFRYTYTSCVGIIWCFLPLYGDSMFGLSGSMIGILVTLGVFISGLLQLPMGYMADRVNKSRMIIIGGFFAAGGVLVPYFADSFSDLLAGVCIFGLGGGIASPAVMALAVIKGEEKKAMGTVMSIVTLAHSLGMLTGSMAAGLFMDIFSLKAVFPCGTFFMLAGIVVFVVMKKSALIRMLLKQ
jgi:MFS transporter, DHA1 family, multidrug resistance protein